MTEVDGCPLGGAHEWVVARPRRWAALRDWLSHGESLRAQHLVCQRCGSSDPLGGSYSILTAWRKEGRVSPVGPLRRLIHVYRRRRTVHMEDAFRIPPWPLFGLPPSWQGKRFLGGHSQSDRTVSALELAHGDPWDPDAPQLRVEVSGREEPLRFLAETLWHQALHPPEELHPEEFAAWSAKQSIEIRTRPDPDWGHRTISVDAVRVDFHWLAAGPRWVGRGKIGTVVLTLTARNFLVEDAALVTIADLEPYIKGGRDLTDEWRH